MRDSKLIEILETLSEAEWKLLNRFWTSLCRLLRMM